MKYFDQDIEPGPVTATLRCGQHVAQLPPGRAAIILMLPEDKGGHDGFQAMFMGVPAELVNCQRAQLRVMLNNGILGTLLRELIEEFSHPAAVQVAGALLAYITKHPHNPGE